MAFLSGIVASLIEWLISQGFSYFQKYVKEKEQQSADEKKTAQNTQTLVDAKTDEERKNANSNLTNTLGGN